ncbi:hypothetical protein NF27_DP01120 [Candidatus Jidaibacter acanthamoeba]|uniref:Uncharacterized protein n=1 Tax=Candidatus Jidaibacter acanthamoebae TaxID=86105 RepID=A0A0C1QNF9_9RICK|nr:hypothetical protein NF27_DP01120 [Candidatus Jidaibacter acanthamoeba]
MASNSTVKLVTTLLDESITMQTLMERKERIKLELNEAL